MVIAVTFLFSALVHAAPNLEFFTDRPHLSTYLGASVYIFNDSESRRSRSGRRRNGRRLVRARHSGTTVEAS